MELKKTRKSLRMCVPGSEVGSAEHRHSRQGLLVVQRVARLEEGRVMANLQPVPLQFLPPVLLAVHNGTLLVVQADSWKAPDAPTAPEPDGLKFGSKHLAFTYMLQLVELMQVDVLQLW